MSDHLLIERSQGVLTLTLNRADKKNALTREMYGDMGDAIAAAESDQSIRAIIIQGSADCFTSGNDVSDFIKNERTGTDSPVYRFLKAVCHASKPLIAAVNGPCAGISYSYAMACDLMVMAESAYLFQPFVGIGLVPDGGATWLLPSFVGAKRAYELMAFGEKLGAEKAVEWGLANRKLPDDDFAGHAMTFAQELAGRSPLGLRYAKEALAFGASHNLGDSISKEAALQVSCIGSDDSKEAIKAFFEKRQPDWQGK